jgi:hypothetical protein
VPRRLRRSALVGLAVAGVVAARAPLATACGYTVRAGAQGRHATRPPLILGDSTMIFAAPWLGRHGLNADAKECRQFAEGVAMLRARARAGTLPKLSILALGANGPVSAGMIDGALRAIGRGHFLGLVTPRRSAATEASMRRAVSAHRGRVLLIDWVSYSAGHGSWFGGDGLHVTPAAGRKYAAFIARAVAPISHPPVRRLHPPRHSWNTKDCGVVHQLGSQVGVRVIRGADRVLCRVARRLARRSPVERLRPWAGFLWSATGRGAWLDLYARDHATLLVGTIRVSRRR